MTPRVISPQGMVVVKGMEPGYCVWFSLGLGLIQAKKPVLILKKAA